MQRVGRDRTKNRRMPKGWAPSLSGTIYFRPTNKADKKIVRTLTGGPLSLRLGATHDEAVATFSRLIVAARECRAEVVRGQVSEIIDRARRDYLPRIENEETRAWRSAHIDELEREFASRRFARNVYDATKAPAGTFLVAVDVQAWIDRGRALRHVAVNRAAQTGRIVWKEARRRWGLTEYNPFEGLEGNRERARETLPDDRAHFFKVYRALDPPARFVLALGRYYGRRPGEARRIEVAGVDADGVHTVRGKRARDLIISWDDHIDSCGRSRPGRLRKMVARAMRWRGKVIRPAKVWKNGQRPKEKKVVSTKLLINRRGRALSKTGFQSAFRRAMAEVGLVEHLGEAMLAGRLVQRTRRAFNPNDTRAKRASTLPRGIATDVLAHDEERTTETVYRRGPKIINLRGQK